MTGDLVVISWWSNTLALACLHRLVEHTRGRRIYVLQTGKRPEQAARFRRFLPPAVIELPYDGDRGAEDWRVREAVARELLPDRAGLWFIDHDLFLEEDAEPWLADMDGRLERCGACLCHPQPVRGPSITNPAVWLSPARFPPGMPGFASLPIRANPIAARPYDAPAARPAELILPEKDTLVAAMEFLKPRGLAYGFPLSERDRVDGGPAPFPRSRHLGGLYTFAAGTLPAEFRGWLARCAAEFSSFFASCPPEWLAVEDGVLLERISAAAARPETSTSSENRRLSDAIAPGGG